MKRTTLFKALLVGGMAISASSQKELGMKPELVKTH